MLREVLDFDDVSARTDHEGRWHIDLIPAYVDFRELDFSYSHPEFLRSIDSSRFQPSATREQLLSRSAVIVLYRGTSLGSSFEPRRPPDHGSFGKARQRPVRSTKERRGRTGIQVHERPAGQNFWIIQAMGYAPEVKSLHSTGWASRLEFDSTKGRTIRGQVFDSKGKPLAGASIATSLWFPRLSLDGRYGTDATGRFVWENAPRHSVELTAWKKDYATAYLKLEPTDDRPIFKLVPASRLRIKGTVTDAATNQSIETFTVVPMVNGGDTLMLDYAKAHHGGQYVFAQAENAQPYRIRIEAKGYLPAMSPEYPHDGGEQVFDARLNKGHWVEGIVRVRDGSALAGAQVIYASGRGISVYGGKGYQLNHHAHMTTEIDGHFSFSPAEGDSRIVALHDQGYAETFVGRLNAAYDLTIEPWGRIEGTLRVAGKPMAHETVVAELDEERVESLWPKIGGENRAQTDEEGRFVIDRLPPGEARVFWQREVKGARKQPARIYRPAFVEVRPGESTRLDLVQEGGPSLVGRVAIPADSKRPPGSTTIKAYLASKPPGVPYHPGIAHEERQEWLRRWWFTEDGKAYRHVKRGFGYGVELQDDGAFHVDEIQPGTYELHIIQQAQAKVVREVVIPEPVSKSARGSVDLGTLDLDDFGQSNRAK